MKNLSIVLIFLFLFVGCASKKLFIQVPIAEPYDAIIVPGFPHSGYQWEGVMKIRVYWSKFLYEKGYTKNIIYSGGAVSSKYIESKAMALYAIKLGIDEHNIFIECEAEHSTENLYYSYLIAKEQGFKKIAVASDPFQSRNLIPFIKKYALPIEIIPICIDTVAALNMVEPKIVIASTIKKDFVPLKIREGFFKRLGGTLGNHIIWHEEDLSKKRQIKRLKRKGRCVSN